MSLDKTLFTLRMNRFSVDDLDNGRIGTQGVWRRARRRRPTSLGPATVPQNGSTDSAHTSDRSRIGKVHAIELVRGKLCQEDIQLS